jgi:hypothetical protein
VRTRLTKLTAAAAIVATIVLTSVSSASAATGSLTVTTLGRNGAKIATWVSAVNLATHDSHEFASGTAKALPAGSYAVLADVWNPADGTDTFAASFVSLGAGAKSITIDARNGRPVSIRLDSDPGTSYSVSYVAAVCVGPFGSGAIVGGNYAGHVFVIPNSSSALRFAYTAIWGTTTPTKTDPYIVSGETIGLPGALNAVFPRSTLATWTTTVRKGPAPATTADLQMYPAPSGDSCSADDLTQQVNANVAPYAVTVHASAGPWVLVSKESYGNIADLGSWSVKRTLTAGGTYSQTFYSAPWGPAHQTPYVYLHQIRFDDRTMFADPSVFGAECCASTTAALSFGGKVISTQRLTDSGGGSSQFKATISSKGWYTLDLSTTRSHTGVTYPADMLSKSNTVNFRFWGNPATVGILPVYLTRFVPSALDMNNHAPAGRPTKVTLVPDRETNDPTTLPLRSVPITKIQAWWSNDDGKTWHSTPVTKSGSTWSTVLTDPASGYVSLRATITNNSGVTTTTILRAFAIS